MALIGQHKVRAGLVVLVVEDHEPIRRLQANALHSWGYEVLTASNADEALRCLAESHADLLITDIRLPGRLDGIALLRAVKRGWADIKVAIVSGLTDELASEDVEDLRAFSDAMLTKPFKLHELEALVANLIG